MLLTPTHPEYSHQVTFIPIKKRLWGVAGWVTCLIAPAARILAGKTQQMRLEMIHCTAATSMPETQAQAPNLPVVQDQLARLRMGLKLSRVIVRHGIVRSG